jgi:5-methyltetrahydrofolate--homocysteine methyltransferase
MNIYEKISKSLEEGDDEKVHQLTGDAISDGLSPKTILDDGLLAGMKIVGDKFKKRKIFLPDVLLSARAMYSGLDLLEPLLIEDEIPSKGRIVIGTVEGDLHDIGKNLVGIMLKGAGFEVIDLGNDVSPEDFINTAVSKEAGMIGMSALLTTTMLVMEKVIQQIHTKNLNKQIKTIIGGAPVSQQFADEIGADAYGYDAGNAVEIISKLTINL